MTAGGLDRPLVMTEDGRTMVHQMTPLRVAALRYRTIRAAAKAARAAGDDDAAHAARQAERLAAAALDAEWTPRKEVVCD